MGTCQCTCNCMGDGKNHEDRLEFRHDQEIPQKPVPLHKNFLEEPKSLLFAESPVANQLDSKPRRSIRRSDQIQTLAESNRSRELKYNLDFEELEEVPVDLLSEAAKNKRSELGHYQFSSESQNQPQSQNWRAIRLPDGSVYVGEWNTEAEPHGNGTMYYTDGGICEGQWFKGKLNGKGRQISANGDSYVGNWEYGLRSGNGTLESTEYFYEGGWKNDLQHGTGEEKWNDGSYFKGEYAYGKKNGQGYFLWKNDNSYNGEFMDNHIHGYGVYKWGNDREYSGTWSISKMHGNGTFKWKDGKIYTGEYKDDKKHGWGVFQWPNGNRYEGFWKNGKQEGQGTMFSDKGKKKTYIWKNGRAIKS